jgi:DNA repair photolyase
MYDWISETWNPISGECPHGCSYCYVKSFKIPALKFKYLGKPRIPLTALKNLCSGKFIFVCSCIDLFACPVKLIEEVLAHCRKYPDNKYLFQTKNTSNLMKYRHWLPKDCILGTTIETNRVYPQMGNTPSPKNRMSNIHLLHTDAFDTMVTVEPIMDFDLNEMLTLIYLCSPEWVNIGADSKGHNLPEPSPEKIKALIDGLRKAKIKVKIKPNLKRLKGD